MKCCNVYISVVLVKVLCFSCSLLLILKGKRSFSYFYFSYVAQFMMTIILFLFCIRMHADIMESANRWMYALVHLIITKEVDTIQSLLHVGRANGNIHALYYIGLGLYIDACRDYAFMHCVLLHVCNYALRQRCTDAFMH